MTIYNEEIVKRSINICNKLANHFLGLSVEFKTLSKSIKQHGLTKDIRDYLKEKISGVKLK